MKELFVSLLSFVITIFIIVTFIYPNNKEQYIVPSLMSDEGQAELYRKTFLPPADTLEEEGGGYSEMS